MDFSIINQEPVLLEFSAGTLTAVRGSESVNFPLDRLPSGGLSAACREKVTAGLQQFVGRKQWQPRVRAICAIGAAGLALRRFNLPVASGEEFQRLLRLKIEMEFPLPPEELAWGWVALSGNVSGQRAVLVAAVRKEVVAEYAAILASARMQTVFTPAALVRSELCGDTASAGAMLEVGDTTSELAVFNGGTVASVRIIAGGAANPEVLPGSVLKAISPDGLVKKWLVSGNAAGLDQVLAQLRRIELVAAEALTIPAGKTAAILGLEQCRAKNIPLLALETSSKTTAARFDFSGTQTQFWLRRAVALLAVLLLLPYAEALLLQPLVAKKYAVAKAEQARLVSVVDPELRFLQFLKQNQPPYLDAFFLFAQATPPGVRLDPVTLNQRGEISLRAVFQNAQQVTDFRSKLNAGGYFTNLVVEEQSPTPDRQRLNVRISARWNVAALRAGLKSELPPSESAKKPAGDLRPASAMRSEKTPQPPTP